MRYAILSDIHANDVALARCLKDAHAQGAESIVCLGDVVGYGPMPREALARIRAEAQIVLAGNHDDAVSGRLDAKDFIDLAGDAVARHREALSSEDLAWLRDLPYACRLDGAVAAHGDIVSPPQFYYIESEEDAAANFEATDEQLIFVGHTHVPAIFVTGASGEVHKPEVQDFMLEDGKRYIVNPGSVGYPRERNGECRSSYVIYDSTAGTITFRTLPFAVSSVMQRGGVSQPRAHRTPWIVAGLLLALALGGILFWKAGWIPNGASDSRNASAEGARPAEPARRLLAQRTLQLDGTGRTVRPNLVLSRGPVFLRIAFYGADGARLNVVENTVAKSCRKPFRIPASAARVEFQVLRAETGPEPSIASFDPKPDR